MVSCQSQPLSKSTRLNDLIILVNYNPSTVYATVDHRCHPFTVLFADHRRIAGILQAVIPIVADEIEERADVGITDALGIGLITLLRNLRP